jgi:hypothetical protein
MTTADIGPLARRLTHDRMELSNRAEPGCDLDGEVSTGWAVRPAADGTTPSAEQVARVVAGILAIGQACDALTRAGWRASIAGNRITVNDDVLVEFIGAGIGGAGGVEARWVIYGVAGARPVWIVGAELQP